MIHIAQSIPCARGRGQTRLLMAVAVPNEKKHRVPQPTSVCIYNSNLYSLPTSHFAASDPQMREFYDDYRDVWRIPMDLITDVVRNSVILTLCVYRHSVSPILV